MKTLPLAACAAALALAARAQNEVTLRVDIKGLGAGDTLALAWSANNKAATPLIAQKSAADEAPLTVPMNEPRLLTLSLKGTGCSHEILASPGEAISVEGKARRYESPMSVTWQFKRVQVEGASLQRQYEDIMSRYRRHIDSIDSRVYNEYKDVARIIERAKENNDEEAIAQMYRTIHGQSYIERVMSTFDEREDYLRSTVSAHRESFMGPLLLLRLAGRLNRTHRPLYEEMSDQAKQSYYGREVRDEVDPPSLLGGLAPTVAVRDTAGSERILSFADHGSRYLLIDFWASWCQPCHKELPNLRRIYDRFHDKGLGLIGVSADHDEEEWLDCVREQGQPWENYLDTRRQAIGEYKVQYIPSIFILDNEGKVVAEKLRGKELYDFVESLFK